MVIHLVANILFLYGKNNAYVHVICFYCRHRRVVNLLCRRISLIICLMCLYWNVIIANRTPLFFIRLFVFNKTSFSMLLCRISVKYYLNRQKYFFPSKEVSLKSVNIAWKCSVWHEIKAILWYKSNTPLKCTNNYF